MTTRTDSLTKNLMYNRSRMNAIQSGHAELNRLASFGSLQGNRNLSIAKGVLAKIGFYYTAKENVIKCDGCDFQHEVLTSAIDPIEEHRRQSPDCKYVVEYYQSFSKTNQGKSDLTFTLTQMDASDFNSQADLEHDEPDDKNNPNPQKIFINSLSKEKIDILRANTFSNWPLITPSAKDMIFGGWAYTSIADRVICIYCGSLFHQWTSSDVPYEIHRLKAPCCPFIRMTEKHVSRSSTSKIEVNNEPNKYTVNRAVNSTFASAPERHKTFETWPHTEENPLPSIESFVDAGFLYTGVKTIVKCFYCNGSLQNWCKNDDPKIEHCRWYPQCAYIRQYIGEDIYQAIQRKKNSMEAQQHDSTKKDAPNSRNVPWTIDEIDKMVKARLDLPIVEKLRKMGFIMGIIRKAYEIQLNNKHDDFKSDNDLCFACLMLHQQVKLINGNQNNVLIPEVWMKNYLQQQEQGIVELSSQNSSISQMSDNKTIPSKTIPQVIKRPEPKKGSDTLGDESMLCVLCLTTKRQVACLPCGHLTCCVSCGHSLKVCPLCRTNIKAFVRIYT